jgi:hypothetical protein
MAGKVVIENFFSLSLIGLTGLPGERSAVFSKNYDRGHDDYNLRL